MSSTPFTVKAVYEYTSEHDDDLNFAIGQIITVTEEEDDEWFFGEYTDDTGAKKEGIFPRNFVEKYEPPAPPRPARPNRPRKEPEHAPPAEPAPEPEPELGPTSPRQSVPEAPEPSRIATETIEDKAPVPQELPLRSPVPDVATSPIAVTAPPPKPAPAPVPAPAPSAREESSQKSPVKPPSPAEKPIGSFKDRIAAFNKPAAPPITPFKPSGLSSGSSGFIKKPFVAPPPSKNAYVPPAAKVAPQKIYRREDDPEFSEPAPAPAPVDTEPPVLEARAPATQDTESGEEDQPKPTSLKERIALLQKQQLEQAARHAEAAQKKEKPRPPKKRAESHEDIATTPGPHGAELERTESSETPRELSPETVREEITEQRPGVKRRSTDLSHLASPPPPSRELVSDTNDADSSAANDTEDAEETSTSKEDVDEAPPEQRRPSVKPMQEQKEEENDAAAEEEEEEEMDPEIKRRMEIRERMAKMSGGMGMMGMFGPPGGMGMPMPGSKKPKPPAEPERQPSGDSEASSPQTRAPPIPIMALPGMHARKASQSVTSPDVERPEHQTPVSEKHPEELLEKDNTRSQGDDEDNRRASLDEPAPIPLERTVPPPPPTQTRPVPPPHAEQSAPPPPAPETRPAPPPPSRPVMSPGDESDDELSVHKQSPAHPSAIPPTLPGQEESAHRHTSTIDPSHPQSPRSVSDKRLSRGPPPIPAGISAPAPAPGQSRPPPPPPPAPVRSSTSDSRPSIAAENDIGEVTEYDGDYDTDIASGVKHKDALKAHERDSSFDEGTIADEPLLQSPRSPPSARPPPLPPTGAPRAVPPPPPTQPPKSRQSVDMPRAPPPPVPPPKEQTVEDDEEYDPFRYTASHPPPASAANASIAVVGSHHGRQEEEEEDDLYSASPKTPGPLPPPSQLSSAPAPPKPSSRPSLDVPRGLANARRSMDTSRPSIDQSFIAMDAELAENTLWWAQPNTPPPVFQNRRDVLFEVEESISKRGGKTMVAKDVYVLFMDYSQTIVSAHYDSRNPSDVSLEQRHEPPPSRLRQDQLENAHVQFGSRISDAVTSKQNTTVGDGSPHSLVQTLLQPLTDALLPVGVRAYGALVYANLANASVQQFDEIRAGDIVTFRNTKFQGHRGTMHQKYSMEVGKPDHVGVVMDWDGTKKKIRAWDQGRESKKVKVESFKLGDLRSGECRVWRVMPRRWVGWEGNQK